MGTLCLYFQVHQPIRLRSDFDYFSIGNDLDYEDHPRNKEILTRIAQSCYLKTNQILLELINQHRGAFRVAFSLSGIVIDQLAQWAPEVLASFAKLRDTGAVEFLSETYYHSLASVASEKEWKRQVRLHREAMMKYFGVEPRVVRNTELIYNSSLAQVAESMGFRGILAEGVESVLGWRSPHFVYQPEGCSTIKLLLKDYHLSDDIAFRFSDRQWKEWPLDASKYVTWLKTASEVGDTINLFLDYETFGEHHKESTGIFDFLRHLPSEVFKQTSMSFMTPSEVLKTYDAVAPLHFAYNTSWADREKDLSAWLGNHLQNASFAAVYALEKDVLASKDHNLIHAWGKLQTSDYLYYMCTKPYTDGEVHSYFNPHASPYDAFLVFANVLNEFKLKLKHATAKRKSMKKTVSASSGAHETEVTPVAAADSHNQDSYGQDSRIPISA